MVLPAWFNSSSFNSVARDSIPAAQYVQARPGPVRRKNRPAFVEKMDVCPGRISGRSARAVYQPPQLTHGCDWQRREPRHLHANHSARARRSKAALAAAAGPSTTTARASHRAFSYRNRRNGIGAATGATGTPGCGATGVTGTTGCAPGGATIAGRRPRRRCPRTRRLICAGIMMFTGTASLRGSPNSPMPSTTS